MKRQLTQALLASLTLALCVPSISALAADRVRMRQGSQSSGRITEISPQEVVVEIGATKRKLPVNEIDSVTFDSEPNELTQARLASHAGRLSDAAALLARVNLAEIERDEIKRDVEFYKAFVAARLALAGQGSVTDAGKRLMAFEKSNRESFHYYQTCETLGDLLSALNKAADAETYYNKLASAPWPEYKIRAAVLVGRSLTAKGEFSQALAKFDEALALSATGKEVDAQKLAARLGRAAALAGDGKSDEAVKSVEQVIAETDAENAEVQARAYNILGNCYLAAGKKKEALLAFLHVDLLYPSVAEQHAEALAHLSTLWAELDKRDRAVQAKSLLKEKYPNSVWASR